MANSSLMQLMTDQLRDLFDAEKQLTKALPRMAKAASDEELAQGFREHAAETQQQAQRIAQIFETLGIRARGKPCEAMKGLIEEGQEVMEQDLDESVRDIALIAAGRRVEHYEMAAYEVLIAGAQAARQPEIVNLLRQTLQEETQTDKRLANVGKRLLKEVASNRSESQAQESSAQSNKSNRGNAGARSSRQTTRSGRAKGGGSHRTSTASQRSSSASRQSGNRQSSSRQSASGGRSRQSNLSRTTTTHEEIRRWAEERGGKPACVMGTGGKGDIGMLRLEFPGKPNARDQKLTPISWDDFFEKFDERGLALVYQDRTANGQRSNFNKLISRENEARPKARAAGRSMAR